MEWRWEKRVGLSWHRTLEDRGSESFFAHERHEQSDAEEGAGECERILFANLLHREP